MICAKVIYKAIMAILAEHPEEATKIIAEKLTPRDLERLKSPIAEGDKDYGFLLGVYLTLAIPFMSGEELSVWRDALMRATYAPAAVGAETAEQGLKNPEEIQSIVGSNGQNSEPITTVPTEKEGPNG